jgi:hypothetical protein
MSESSGSTTRTVKIETSVPTVPDAPAARAIGFDTRLPFSRQFDSSAAVERLAAPSRGDRVRLARAPRPVGWLRRLRHDAATRWFVLTTLAAALAGGYVALA